MKKISTSATVSAFGASLATPFLAFAQTGINTGVIASYSSGIITVINSILVPVLIAVAFIVFLWGVYKYFILGASSESDKGEGRKFAMWGIIGFVVILSVWGLVAIVRNTFGLETSVGAPKSPTFQVK